MDVTFLNWSKLIIVQEHDGNNKTEYRFSDGRFLTDKAIIAKPFDGGKRCWWENQNFKVE